MKDQIASSIERHIRILPDWTSEDDWLKARDKVIGEINALIQIQVCLSHDDLCLLSRVFNETHASAHGADYRINQWLTQQIASAAKS